MYHTSSTGLFEFRSDISWYSVINTIKNIILRERCMYMHLWPYFWGCWIDPRPPRHSSDRQWSMLRGKQRGTEETLERWWALLPAELSMPNSPMWPGWDYRWHRMQSCRPQHWFIRLDWKVSCVLTGVCVIFLRNMISDWQVTGHRKWHPVVSQRFSFWCETMLCKVGIFILNK